MIGIFDSGIGGLSVLKELRKLSPQIPFIYYADNANVPYGEKSNDFILERSLKIAQYLLDYGADSLLIACNTATAVAAETLRERFAVPVIAVEPPIKPAIEQTKTSVVAVIATEVTLASNRYRNLINRYAGKVRILERVSNDLVPIVEDGIIDKPDSQKSLNKIISGFLAEGADTIVLGSTHFYFLADSIKKLSNSKIFCLSPSEPSARQAYNLLSSKNADLTSNLSVFKVSGNVFNFDKSLQSIFKIDTYISEQAEV